MSYVQAWPTVFAAFCASFVEGVEALTVVLAVGVSRGWFGALIGSASAAALLIVLVLAFGPVLTRIPLAALQLVVGSMLLMFGLRWLRKAILRSAGVIPLHDEAVAYAEQVRLQNAWGGAHGGWDRVAIGTAFEIVMLEGIEVVFIVVAIGAGGAGLLLPAGLGAVAALLIVVILGIVVHRPLSKVPENLLKLIVGVLLSAFGTYWAGEGLGVQWPGADVALLGLVAGFVATAALAVRLARAARSSSGTRAGS